MMPLLGRDQETVSLRILVDGAVLEFFSLGGRAAAKGFNFAIDNNEVLLFSSTSLATSSTTAASSEPAVGGGGGLTATTTVYTMGCGWIDDVEI